MKTYDIQWESEDTPFEDKKDQAEEETFEDLLASSTNEQPSGEDYRPGEKVRALIVQIPEQGSDIMLELGAKDSATIAKEELLSNGQLNYKVGDSIEAFVVGRSDGELILSNSLTHKIIRQNALEHAYGAKLPVRGKVLAANKGGFEVSLLGRTAFCPISQIDNVRVNDPQVYLGKEFDFLVQRIAGRNVVVSRVALLKRQAKETLDKLEIGQEVDGVVRELRTFGAMVDIGSVIGLLPISEISYAHVKEVEAALRVGQNVHVKILSMEEQSYGAPRIRLSAKQATIDPWTEVHLHVKLGESYRGNVVRLTNFGAFVELYPGLDGLIHVSEMSWVKRVNTPSELLSLGDSVDVRVLEVNPEKRRISLTMKALANDPWLDIKRDFAEESEHEVAIAALKSFGALAELKEGVQGLIPQSYLRKAFGDTFRKRASPPQTMRVKVKRVDSENRKILLYPVELDNADDAGKDYEEFLKLSEMKKQKDETAEGSTGSFGELLRASLEKKFKA
ncbi:MAG: S1 RNA-binding domain-containing protein [Deltaproteobacteria bacterium]|nr:S1 RNA-binding domain-containing protein [Deltaproteobacteria bacterium]